MVEAQAEIIQVLNHKVDNQEVLVVAAVHLAVNNQVEVLHKVIQVVEQVMEVTVATDIIVGPEVAAEVPAVAEEILAAEVLEVQEAKVVQVMFQEVQLHMLAEAQVVNHQEQDQVQEDQVAEESVVTQAQVVNQAQIIKAAVAAEFGTLVAVPVMAAAVLLSFLIKIQSNQ